MQILLMSRERRADMYVLIYIRQNMYIICRYIHIMYIDTCDMYFKKVENTHIHMHIKNVLQKAIL